MQRVAIVSIITIYEIKILCFENVSISIYCCRDEQSFVRFFKEHSVFYINLKINS